MCVLHYTTLALEAGQVSTTVQCFHVGVASTYAELVSVSLTIGGFCTNARMCTVTMCL